MQWGIVEEYGDTIKNRTLVEEGITQPVLGPYFDKWVESRGRNDR